MNTKQNRESTETKHFLVYDMHSAKVSWCPICKRHFYNERNEIHTTLATEEHYHEIDETRIVRPESSVEVGTECMYCGDLVPGSIPKMCCDGRDCGCMGLP